MQTADSVREVSFRGRKPNGTKHDAATCPQCRMLAAGQTHIRGGDIAIPPFCEPCDGHHFKDWHRTSHLPKSLCPGCRKNRREVEHIPQAMRRDRKRYAPGCRSCMEADGLELVTVGDIAYWSQPLPQVVDTMPDADIFDSLNGIKLPSGRWSK